MPETLPPSSSAALPAPAVTQLSAYVDERTLRSMCVRTGMPWRLLPVLFRATAMTFGSNVLFREGGYRPDTARGLALIAHEAVHIRQYREMGVVRFLIRYGIGALRARFVHAAHEMEQEPRQVQARVRQELTQAGL